MKKSRRPSRARLLFHSRLEPAKDNITAMLHVVLTQGDSFAIILNQISGTFLTIRQIRLTKLGHTLAQHTVPAAYVPSVLLFVGLESSNTLRTVTS